MSLQKFSTRIMSFLVFFLCLTISNFFCFSQLFSKPRVEALPTWVWSQASSATWSALKKDLNWSIESDPTFSETHCKYVSYWSDVFKQIVTKIRWETDRTAQSWSVTDQFPKPRVEALPKLIVVEVNQVARPDQLQTGKGSELIHRKWSHFFRNPL